MILYISYEEMRALQQGAHALLHEDGRGGCAVAAPPEVRARVEALEERLAGDLGVSTLAEQRATAAAVAAIVDCLRTEMEALVGDTHPAHEGAVAAYFDFAHGLSVLTRLRELGSEMEAMIEVVTGRPADGQAAAAFQFPD